MAMLMGADRVLERIEALWDELNGLEDRLAARFTPAPSTAPDPGLRLAALEEAVRRVAVRQEEILAYLAIRLNGLVAAQATYLGDHVALTFLESGHRIYVDTRDVGIAPHLLTTGQWEPGITALFRRLLRPGDRALDLGVNHGMYTLLAADAVGPSGEVHAFEANPRLARLARHSVLANGFAERARVHDLAVGEAEGAAVLAFDDAWSAAGHLRNEQPDGLGRPCRVVALDDVFPDPGFVVGAIKMAVEGTEGRAIRGMRRLLERSPDVRIVMEFAPALLADAGVPAAKVAAMLGELGFRAWEIAPDGSLAPAAWEALAAETGGVRNLLVARGEPIPGEGMPGDAA